MRSAGGSYIGGKPMVGKLKLLNLLNLILTDGKRKSYFLYIFAYMVIIYKAM